MLHTVDSVDDVRFCTPSIGVGCILAGICQVLRAMNQSKNCNMQARPANLNVSFSFGYGAAIQVSFSEKNRFRIWLMAVKVRV